MRIQSPLTSTILKILFGGALLAGCDGGGSKGDTDASGTSGGEGETGSAGEAGSASETAGEAGTGGECVEMSGPTLADDIQPILDATCVDECHVDESSAAWALFLLSEGDSYEYLLGPSAQIDVDFEQLNVVEPCSLEKSYLWHKLNGTQDSVGGIPNQMPAKKDPMKPGYYVFDMMLPAADMQLIEDWINAGAPEG